MHIRRSLLASAPRGTDLPARRPEWHGTGPNRSD